MELHKEIAKNIVFQTFLAKVFSLYRGAYFIEAYVLLLL
jgi:hypothetical protein